MPHLQGQSNQGPAAGGQRKFENKHIISKFNS